MPVPQSPCPRGHTEGYRHGSGGEPRNGTVLTAVLWPFGLYPISGGRHVGLILERRSLLSRAAILYVRSYNYIDGPGSLATHRYMTANRWSISHPHSAIQ